MGEGVNRRAGGRVIRDSDSYWVERALGGSQEAYRELVRRFERPVFSLILRMVRDRAVAEELTQDAFVRAFQSLASYDPQRKLSSWLFKIAHNMTIDHLRRKRVDTISLEGASEDDPGMKERLADTEVPSPESAAESSDLGKAMTRAVGRLRPEVREVFLLRFQEGLAYQDIADVTGLALGTVKTHLHRARKELARILEAEGWVP